MTDCEVVLKGGMKLIGPLWTWRPKEGWFDLVLEPGDHNGKVWLRDVVSAVERRVMTHFGVIEDVNLILRALNEGWDGK